MKFERTKVFGIAEAIRGMRNPMASYDRADTQHNITVNDAIPDGAVVLNSDNKNYISEWIKIGPNDMKLAKTLVRNGSVHRKFLRQIFVSVDITAPLYWWKEFDTYKIGTVANSESTMHKLASTPIDITKFEIDDADFNYTTGDDDKFLQVFIPMLEDLRKNYVETKDKKVWKTLIRWLPESWLQMRTVTMNYENLISICSKGQRRIHKLNEWCGHDDPLQENFIKWARTLPYAAEFIFPDEEEIN